MILLTIDPQVQRVHNPAWLARYRRARAELGAESSSGDTSERMAFLVHPRASEVLTKDFQDGSGELHASFRDGKLRLHHVIRLRT